MNLTSAIVGAPNYVAAACCGLLVYRDAWQLDAGRDWLQQSCSRECLRYAVVKPKVCGFHYLGIAYARDIGQVRIVSLGGLVSLSALSNVRRSADCVRAAVEKPPSKFDGASHQISKNSVLSHSN